MKRERQARHALAYSRYEHPYTGVPSRLSRVGWLAVMQETRQPVHISLWLRPIEQKKHDSLKQEESDERDSSHDL